MDWDTDETASMIYNYVAGKRVTLPDCMMEVVPYVQDWDTSAELVLKEIRKRVNKTIFAERRGGKMRYENDEILHQVRGAIRCADDVLRDIDTLQEAIEYLEPIAGPSYDRVYSAVRHFQDEEEMWARMEEEEKKREQESADN